MRVVFEKETTAKEMQDFFNKFVEKEITRILPLSTGQTLVEFN